MIWHLFRGKGIVGSWQREGESSQKIELLGYNSL